MEKTNITDLIRIFNSCKSEKRDDQITLSQLQGEIFSKIKDIKIAEKVGKEAFNVIQSHQPANLTANRKAIDNSLLPKHQDVLRSSYRL